MARLKKKVNRTQDYNEGKSNSKLKVRANSKVHVKRKIGNLYAGRCGKKRRADVETPSGKGINAEPACWKPCSEHTFVGRSLEGIMADS